MCVSVGERERGGGYGRYEIECLCDIKRACLGLKKREDMWVCV